MIAISDAKASSINIRPVVTAATSAYHAEVSNRIRSTILEVFLISSIINQFPRHILGTLAQVVNARWAGGDSRIHLRFVDLQQDRSRVRLWAAVPSSLAKSAAA